MNPFKQIVELNDEAIMANFFKVTSVNSTKETLSDSMAKIGAELLIYLKTHEVTELIAIFAKLLGHQLGFPTLCLKF